MSSTISTYDDRPALPDDIVKEYIRWYGTHVVGREAWTLAVVMKDASPLRVRSVDKRSFWSKICIDMNDILDKNQFTSRRLKARPIDRCEGGLEFIATDEHIWRDGLYFKGYDKDEIIDEDPSILDWAQIRCNGSITWLEGRSAIVSFATKEKLSCYWCNAFLQTLI